MKIDVSIIIVSYNVAEYIISCIESIYKHSLSNNKIEIIVVDNNSSDQSSKLILDSFPNVKLIQNDFNEGYSKGVNQGAEISEGKSLLILNPDTLFVEDSIFKLSKAYEENEGGIFGPKLIDENNLKQQSYWRKPSLFNTILSVINLDFFNIIKNYNFKNFDFQTRVETISGAAIFIDKLLFEKFKGFNESLFWMEDIDLCVRLKKSGHSIFYFPETKIVHFIGRSSQKNQNVATFNQLNSKIKYFYIHHTKLAGFFIFSLTLIVILLKIFLLFFISKTSKKYNLKLKSYIFAFKSILKV